MYWLDVLLDIRFNGGAEGRGGRIEKEVVPASGVFQVGRAEVTRRSSARSWKCKMETIFNEQIKDYYLNFIYLLFIIVTVLIILLTLMIDNFMTLISRDRIISNLFVKKI